MFALDSKTTNAVETTKKRNNILEESPPKKVIIPVRPRLANADDRINCIIKKSGFDTKPPFY